MWAEKSRFLFRIRAQRDGPFRTIHVSLKQSSGKQLKAVESSRKQWKAKESNGKQSKDRVSVALQTR